MKPKTNIMDELAVYGAARAEAKDLAADTDQTGTAVFGFKDTAEEYEITTGSPEELADYNVDFTIYAPDKTEFNLIVRKDNAESIHKMPQNKQRELLSRILDSV